MFPSCTLIWKCKLSNYLPLERPAFFLGVRLRLKRRCTCFFQIMVLWNACTFLSCYFTVDLKLAVFSFVYVIYGQGVFSITLMFYFSKKWQGKPYRTRSPLHCCFGDMLPSQFSSKRFRIFVRWNMWKQTIVR